MSKNSLTFLLFGVVLFLLVFTFFRIGQPRVLSVEEMKVNGFIKYGTSNKLRDFSLEDHFGAKFSQQSLKDKKLNLLYFGYTTCPSECPVMMSVMRQVYDKIDTNNIAYYLITFDPEIDTQERLKSYVTAFNKNFVGVSGTKSEISKLGFQLGINKLDPEIDHNSQRIIEHTNHLVVVGNDSKIIGVFRPPFDSNSMSLVIKSLLRSN